MSYIYRHAMVITNNNISSIELLSSQFGHGIQGLVKRFVRDVPNNPKYLARLKEEFKIVQSKGFTKVFHQVRTILDLAGDTPHLLRGSAASSLICYLLGISDIDPLKYNITLARFMNNTRTDYPDIDIDFPHYARDNIWQSLRERYPGMVARISNNVRFKPKSALREAIRKFGYRKRVPKRFNLADIFPDKYTQQQVRSYAKFLVGKHRTWALHCGGVIIYKDKIPSNLLLNKQRDQVAVTKYDVDDNNLIKIDLLCSRGLSVITELSNKKICDYDHYDTKTAELLQTGDNLGIIQGESRTMRKAMMALGVKNAHHVALCLALIRPAAADGGRKAAFLKEKIRKPKQIIYDEDSIHYIAESIGCDYAQADRYRRGFSKGNPAVIAEFASQLNENQQNDKVIQDLQQLRKYSFCKGHALAYGQMVWAQAYHKAHNPRMFWKAVLKHSHSSYRSWVHKREAICNGIEIYNPKMLIASEQFKQTKWWDGNEFLPNMGIQKDGDKIYFRGVVANAKAINKTGERVVMMCIGYDNQKYVDLIIPYKAINNAWNIIEGVGRIKQSVGVSYIEVEKCLPGSI